MSSPRPTPRPSILIAVAAVAAVATAGIACDDEPSGPGAAGLPDIVGTYGGTWEITIEVPASGQAAVFTCPGIAGVSSLEPDGSFTGVWTQGTAPNCTVEFGSLAGRVMPDAALTISEFTNESGLTFEESTGGQCTLQPGAESYSGTANGYLFEISRTVLADCQGTEFRFTWSLTATE